MRTVHRSVFSCVSIIIALLLLGSQCARQDDQEEGPTTPEAITFWHFRSEPKQREALRQIVARFEHENNCTVHMVDLTWGEGKAKLFAAFNSGTEPDVVELGGDWIMQFSAGGVLKNLSRSRITLDKFAENTHPAARFQDSVYALPWNLNTRVMFYNKDLLRQAGITRLPSNGNELLQAAQAIQALGDAQQAAGNLTQRVYGFGANGSDEHRLHKKILPFFWSAGGAVLDDSGRVAINSKNNIEALTLYVNLARAGFIETQRQLDNMFVRGKLGFWISGSWLIEKIARENPTLNYGVMLMPPLSSSHSNTQPAHGISILGCNYVAVTYKTRNPLLAKRFLLYITDGKQALELLKNFQDAGIPADTRYMHDSIVRSFLHNDIFLQQIAFSRLPPMHKHWLDIERVIEDAVVEALYGIRSPEQALNRAQWLITDIVTRP
ncbi:MAG: sugar ABC transporter substrate-binding protein [Bacteroidota bacterium]|nr:sugar ABC transporter substrate-binding protein [Candidatus Kapabacteria bacterium]MDW8219988.1 sugar ABC transporter substrate-binding protein [Bacteroidota bacterium]